MTTKGLTVDVYSAASYPRTAGQPLRYTLVHPDLDGPFEPTEDRPEVNLVVRNIGGQTIVHAEPAAGPEGSEQMVGPMAGGSYIGTTDSRWSSLLESILGHRFYGAIPLHDRWETQRHYNSNF